MKNLKDRFQDKGLVIFLLILTYKAFYDSVGLNISFSEILSAMLAYSIICLILTNLGISANRVLIVLFFIVLVLGLLQYMNFIHLPDLNPDHIGSVFYSSFFSLSFLILMNNINNRNFDNIIVKNFALAIIISAPFIFKKMNIISLPDCLNNYIPVLFLILNLTLCTLRNYNYSVTELLEKNK